MPPVSPDEPERPDEPDRPSWLEDDDEFEGVGAHPDNPRYDPVDE